MSREPREPGTSLPVVAPPDPAEARDRTSDVRGVLLAAGTSSRFGDRNKLLEAVAGEPLVRRAARTLASSSLDGVTVVVGHEAERVRRAVGDLDVAIRVNDAYDEGQSTSLRMGVETAREHGADAVVVGLGDMPDVAPATVDRLVVAYEEGAGSALAAACKGVRGNPVLFDARFFDALVGVDGDVGGRSLLLDADDAAVVETGDPGVLRDVDRPADLRDRR